MYFAEVYTQQLTKPPGHALEILVNLAVDELKKAFPEVSLQSRRVKQGESSPALWLMVPDTWYQRKFRKRKEEAKKAAREMLRDLGIISPHGEKTNSNTAPIKRVDNIPKFDKPEKQPKKKATAKNEQQHFSFDSQR